MSASKSPSASQSPSASASPTVSISPSASQSPSASVSPSPELAGSPGYFLYLRPDECATLNQPVDGGPTDTSGLQPHQPHWLTDGRTGRPVRGTSGSATWRVARNSPSLSGVNFLAAANTNLDAGLPITVSGDVGGTLVSSRRGDGVGHNPWTTISLVPAGIEEIFVAISGNTETIVFGEFFAGLARQLRRGTQPGGQRQKDSRFLRTDTWSSLPGYDVKCDRYLQTWQVTVDHGEFRAIQEWEEATQRGLLPSVIVPDTRVNDCFVVRFSGFAYRKQNPHTYEVDLRFIEYPRHKW